MTLVSSDPITVEPNWHRVPAHGGWINALHCMPDMEHPDNFILTMDGPRGGEYGRIKVTRKQLLEMIVGADQERDRVNAINTR